MIALFLLSVASATPPGCLPPPELDELGEDTGIVFTSGLSRAQVVQAMDDTLIEVGHCLPDTLPVHGPLMARLRVGCNGAVIQARLTEDADLPTAERACIEAAIRATRFPPHDLVTGFAFDYRIDL